MFKVNGQPTQELIEKFNNDDNIFYRFQNPKFDLDENSESWGMIYGTREEAIENAENDGLTEDEAVLPGKSCMPTFEEILNWSPYFNNDDVLLVFEGRDTRVTGHDGEYVAYYWGEVATWSMEDVKAYLEKQIK